MIDRPAKFQSRLSVFGFSPRKNSAKSSSFHHHHVSFLHNMSTIGIPIKLLHESQGHIVTVELTNGQVYRGKLLEGINPSILPTNHPPSNPLFSCLQG